jgi:hypothetical protein
MREHHYHPEAKCADADGNVCRKQTVGLLQRRHIRIERIRYVGKESNSLEEVESGTVHSDREVYTEYVDRHRDEWETTTRPALKEMCLSTLIKETTLSRRTLIEARAGRSRPHRKNQKLLAKLVRSRSTT